LTWPVSLAGGQTVGTNKAGWVCPVDGTVVDVRAWVNTAPTGASLIVDVNKNGTTLFTNQANRPTVAASGNASTTTLPDVTSVSKGDRLSLDVDQVGSTVAGSDLWLTVTLRTNPAQF
jgi:hypothetical protein